MNPWIIVEITHVGFRLYFDFDFDLGKAKGNTRQDNTRQDKTVGYVT
jgi:hypothetical protein